MYELLPVLNLLRILPVPILILIAAFLLWNSAPPWIPLVFILNAAMGALSAIPMMLQYSNRVGASEIGTIWRILSPLLFVVGLAFGAALIALALHVKRQSLELELARR